MRSWVEDVGVGPVAHRLALLGDLLPAREPCSQTGLVGSLRLVLAVVVVGGWDCCLMRVVIFAIVIVLNLMVFDSTSRSVKGLKGKGVNHRQPRTTTFLTGLGF